MSWLYTLSVCLHVLCAAIWIGGVAFIALVAVPWLRQGDRAMASAFFTATGPRFRAIAWTCFALLLVTGSYNLWARGVRLEHLTSWTWLTSRIGTPILLKLSGFVVIALLSAIHDFWLGPRATVVMRDAPTSAEAQRLRRAASWLGRLNALLALWMIFAAVTLVRGLPR